ncbi:MAG TPA: hypothetical protein VKM72_14835 [Thermoanaerobaculia bacterium]|nr:hypothetical protein [Thermoanaerobaculia bacterium]
MSTDSRAARARSWMTGACMALCLLVPATTRAQETPDTSVAGLRQEIEELKQTISALERRLADLEPTEGQAPAPPATAEVTPPPEAPPAEPAAAQAPPPADSPPVPPAEPAPTEEPPPLTIVSAAGGKNFLNLSLDGLVAAGTSTAGDVGALEVGGHDPAQRGFTVQNVETVFEGAVDPYFRGQANLIFQITPEGETQVELEEAYVTTTSLPYRLQAKAGQFFTEFGRLNPTHPHAWDFVDQPLVNGRFFGPDGLRSTGLRLSWLLPSEFYSEAFLTVQNSQGETVTSFRGTPGETLFGRETGERPVASFSDLLVVPRYSASFDLSDTQTILLGASAALGPNGTGSSARTRIYGLDGFWKWKPVNAFQGFPFVKVQAEVMRRGATVGATEDLPAASFSDWGGYLQANWGYRARKVVALRIDRVGGDSGEPRDPALGARWRLSPAFTWFPTEYSKLRLQYNFDRGDTLQQDEHSLWLQLEFLLGAHAAHKF